MKSNHYGKKHKFTKRIKIISLCITLILGILVSSRLVNASHDPWDSLPPDYQKEVTDIMEEIGNDFLNDYKFSLEHTMSGWLGWEKGAKATFKIGKSWVGERYSNNGKMWIKSMKNRNNKGLHDNNFSGTIEGGAIHFNFDGSYIHLTRLKENNYSNQFLYLKGDMILDTRGQLYWENAISYYWNIYWDYIEDLVKHPLQPVKISLDNLMEKPPILSIKSKKITEKVSLNEKLKQPEEYYNIISSMNRKKTAKFIEFPDFSKVGKTTGIIEVTETTADGYSQKATVEINFEVEDSRQLKAEAIPQKTILGSDTGSLVPNMLVKNVELGEQSLTSDKYAVKIKEKANTNLIGEQKMIVTVSAEGKSIDVDVPVTVKWGSTVFLKGDKDYSIGAVTLHQSGDSLLLTDREGIARNQSDTKVHSHYSDKIYYNLRLLVPENNPKNLKNLKVRTKKNSLASAHGQANAIEHINAFGDYSNGQQSANIGDILEVTHEQASIRERLMINEKEVKENAGYTQVYYELTKNGFIPLRVNQLQAKQGTLPIYADKSYLDQRVKDYIDLKGYQNINIKEFLSYPDTRKSGKTFGKILVEETLKSGKMVQWEYEVKFTVSDGELKLSTPQSLIFKDFSPSLVEQTVQRKYSGDLGLIIKDSRGSGKQGNWYLTANVKQNTSTMAPYFIYAKKGQSDQYLVNTAKIYSQAKQETSAEPLEVKVSTLWSSNEGILLRIPPERKIEGNKTYSDTIYWNLVEGP